MEKKAHLVVLRDSSCSSRKGAPLLLFLDDNFSVCANTFVEQDMWRNSEKT